MKTKKVYILLQGYQCLFGDIYKMIRGSQYNHASIGIQDSMEEFYSFRKKWGLCIEHPFRFNKEHKKDVQCMIYEIAVTDAQYEQIDASIQSFLKHRDTFHFSYASILLGFLGIPHNFKRGYYCSKFVAEVLKDANITDLKKHTSLYLPSDFEMLFEKTHFEGRAKHFNSHYLFKP